MVTLWSSCNGPNMLLPWSPVQEMTWFNLWQMYRMTYKKNVIWRCYMKIWTNPVLWCMLGRWRRLVKRGRIGIQRAQGSLTVEIQKVGLIFMTSQDPRRYFQIKFHLNFLNLEMKMILARKSQRGRLGVRLLRKHLLMNVERSILVLSSLGRTNSMVVGWSGTRGGIVLMLRGKRRFDRQVVLVRLQTRTAFMLFFLKVSNIPLRTWWPTC